MSFARATAQTGIRFTRINQVREKITSPDTSAGTKTTQGVTKGYVFKISKIQHFDIQIIITIKLISYKNKKY
ncbi:hypothetical protein DD595_25725 [Enterobacter cloacae complex sp. 4DZ3-17B2]|nr:hypothetical protein DD595_25725 [Enterobacter cloacae complex sp. 4DZ3-17B2]